MKDPINLSIGQPDFDVPEPIKDAAHRGHRRGQERATRSRRASPTCATSCRRGSTPRIGHADREVLVTSGTSGGLVAGACWSLVNPGDEVIVFDPYFVMYPHLVDAGRRQAGARRHLSRLPDRPRTSRAARSRRGPSAFCSTAPATPPASSPTRGGSARPGRAGRRAERRCCQRRDLPPLLLRRSPFVSPGRSSTRTRWSSTASARATA